MSRTHQSTWKRPEKSGLYDPAFEHESCGVGFVAQIKGLRSHDIMQDANVILRNMDHRGACGCEPNSGDGAGILTALPHEFLTRVAQESFSIVLPPPGRYAAGVIFFPSDKAQRDHCRQIVEQRILEQGQRLMGWRQLPTASDVADLGPTALRSEPVMEQLFIAADDRLSPDAFERQLYRIRKRATRDLRGDSGLEQRQMFYICSLSSKVIVYKGMLTPEQLRPYFPDLSQPDYTTHLAMVHSRFSTNTFPSWDRAQPNRFMSHNGEINTLRGNINSMAAREGMATSELYGDTLSEMFPVVEPDCSDSGTFDNVLEFLLMTGRTLQESVMMMIPEAWQKHESMPEAKRAFYEFHSCLMEPWDGPASIAFTDGKYIGAVLDRNGLRPSRYYVTSDDRVIMASEAGVLPLDPELVIEKGRLQPGRMFLIDFDQGRLIPDEELKTEFSAQRPYAQWLRENRIELTDLVGDHPSLGIDSERLVPLMRAFGFTLETMQFMLVPLIHEERDPLGSMGNDSALACLSDQARLIYDYFKQLFAQVTNPAIDSIREEVIMSLECYIGPESNLLDASPQHAQRLRVPHPILTNEELASIKHMSHKGWTSQTIDMTYDAAEPESGLETTLQRICAEAETAIDQGHSLIVLSDRNTDSDRIAVSALLACGAVHQHLVRVAKRTRIGMILETGEAREVHHHCLLFGFGADAINPYLAFASLSQARCDGLLQARYDDDEKIVAAYRKGVAKGMLKVMGKMGISTLQSYKGAQIFEAVGLNQQVIERCFSGTASRVEGVGFDVLAAEASRRHRLGFPRSGQLTTSGLENAGEFHWRAEGERHGWEPKSITDLQIAARNDDRGAYQRFSKLINEETNRQCALRGLLRLKPGQAGPAVELDSVEPASEIVKRFCTGAMSFGSISTESHETLAIAMNRLGGKSNTGEGGEDPERFQRLKNGDSKRSAIKQVASGRFGVTIWYLTNADELQIKIAQGAKPGEGGELPGRKVDHNIARIRYSTPGVGLISPPPHHDIYSIEDLKQLIHDLKNANREARISVKLVSEVGVGTIAAGVSKAYADHILISGDSGGTGASPLTSIKHAGLPWELGIAETHQTLVMNDLRSRVVLQTDGGLKTGRDVVVAALLGAEEFGFSTAPLITLGCIMMRKCHLNTCPVGIATQDPQLRAKFEGKPEHVVNYLFMVAEEVRQLMAELGFRRLDEMIGRVDCLDAEKAIGHWKADGLDLSRLLAPAERPHDGVEVRCTRQQDHGLENALDHQLIALASDALENANPIKCSLPIVNTNRTVGAILSNEIAKRWGENGLKDNTITFQFEGSAGQSFGAFLAKGVTLELEGDANDYVGKGLSGGRIAIRPPAAAKFVAEENIIVGNVVLYGATEGEAFFCGQAAERFAVRNSGAQAVIEGVGDHGCEYMTGGRVVVLGPTGRNFAAGMSGGIAYVWDPNDSFLTCCNLGMVELERIETDTESNEVLELITRHRQWTGSNVADSIIRQWPNVVSQFIKVMPIDYKRVLAEKQTAIETNV